ncbi:MAG TPA: SpvB/TcaC N-terminal domain-containing protein [Chitinophaga sp.]|uniref:SpvB/TcaC N-terminal domain-containing protein n=1 Tax=Chitinophaga sp. TaxID=1869181 RepID=UPI002D15D617|nr:SpvB/TcaC N-terminal domain-containing protein [Chitinophaga sp.]HVI47983.1 SpvB/TcaC N-terminal domain-containing protein [Chitinophaga sp.]
MNGKRNSTSVDNGSSVSATPKTNAGNSAGTFNNYQPTLPAINLPRGGGAIKGIEEKFQVNAVNGTASFSVPLPVSPARHGFTPVLALNYNSGNGNSPFGIGWELEIPRITRRTEKQLPQYNDANESDTFIMSGAEHLVPLLEKQGGQLVPYTRPRTENAVNYTVYRYCPRIEGLFARIEKWEQTLTGEVHWRTVSTGNVHAYFGVTSESRVTDPDDSSRVFEWLLSYTHDDKGNICIYRYKQEDFQGIDPAISEQNRLHHCTQVYLKTVFYGNKQPWYPGGNLPADEDFLFRVVFDYGEHDTSVTVPKDIDIAKHTWGRRQDPFSTYRAGFEIRTYRRCSRVMLFHCFTADELPHSPYLVRTMQFFYKDELDLAGAGSQVPHFSYLVKLRQSGYKWDADANAYSSKFLPETIFHYEQHSWNTSVKAVAEQSTVHIPQGIDGKQYIWIDLYNEGISGVLTGQAGSWFYKRNLGNGDFSPAQVISPKPSFGGLQKESAFLQELEGEGTKYLVHYEKEPKGFFKLLENGEWTPFKNFISFPNIDQQDPNTRRIDLTGSGRADILVTEADDLRWYESLGEQGFDVSRKVTQAIDEEKGPFVIFSDKTQCIFLVDMNGDGLTDIVRIRNGEVCYWPNMGYGHFGAKVAMEDAPVFDYSDKFDPAYIRLADIDGSGTTDIIYLGRNDFRVWMNLNGNGFTAGPQIINPFPEIHNLADVSVLDFLGTGTACIVYSSPLQEQHLLYIDLMDSKKPHLFTGYINNTGLEVTIQYKPSTWYYLEDKKLGRPWITRLPFPVHCIDKVTTTDKVRETVYVSSYHYSHGYFDTAEREFRGFARVESYDTEDFAQFKLNNASNVVEEDLHQPPVKTVSWYHTGAYLNREKILQQCKQEYFQHPDFAECVLPELEIVSKLADNTDWELTADEEREALRACKGLLLRSEVYAEDHEPESDLPYSTSQSTYSVKLIQPRAGNRYAVFQVLPAESVSYGYDRKSADPRISHSFILGTDRWGNVTQSATVVYPRVKRPVGPESIPDKVWEEQSKMHVQYGETLFTNDIDEDNVYRLRVGYEATLYTMAGIVQPPAFYLNKNGLRSDISTAALLLFETPFTTGKQKKIVSHSRQYFIGPDMSSALSLGTLSPLGIAYKTYQLAFTKNLVTARYGMRVTDLMLTDAKYVHSEGDEDWWVQSGTAIYAANPAANGYTPIGARDVYNNESLIEFDDYTLLIKSATNALGHTEWAENDYRTLGAVMTTDMNLNRTAIETDELGMVFKTAVMGKAGAGEGDTLEDPTIRMEYELFNWQNNAKPNFVHTFMRERHNMPDTRWQESYAYSDGEGGVIMTKVPATPGKARRWNAITKQVDEVDADPRWVGNGRTIFNNKGNAVKKYEPYFSATSEYESEAALVETGVTAITYYDAVGRISHTNNPNGTFVKAVYAGWTASGYDANDTVKDSRWYIDRGSPDPVTDPEPADPERRAAWLAAKHYNTPTVVHADSMGRSFYSVSDFGGGKTTAVYNETAPDDSWIKLYDQLDRCVAETHVNILGTGIYTKNAEKGETWSFVDVMGRLVRVWDNDLREIRATFDKLHRPVSAFVKEGLNEILFNYAVYGDILPDAVCIPLNLKGRAYKLFDQAGGVTMGKIDFKGNLESAQRQLAVAYKQALDWKVLDGLTTIADIDNAANLLLENEAFTTTSQFDALGRATSITLPDATVVEPTYDEANHLKSLRAKIRGTGGFITFLQGQDYDAKGLRLHAEYGNGLITRYFHDPNSYRLINLITQTAGSNDVDSHQNLFYTYDPVGNIVQIRDDAQQTHYFNNAVVKPESFFEYNANYQLKKATGREHAGLGGNVQRNNNDLPFIAQLPHSNDADAVRNYTELYDYDDCGNILQLQHIATNANWTQRYHYHYQDDATNFTNRLKSSSLPGDAPGIFSAIYQHDQHGNMTMMPHLPAADSLQWNFMAQLQQVDLGGGGKAYYVYGAGGGRIRKVIERIGGKRLERIYLGVVEIYREYQGGDKRFERNTVHISDNSGRIAQVDTKLLDTDNVDAGNPLNINLMRYQYGNHLGSAVMETDGDGTVVSYEEYHAYGTSAYRSSKSDVDLSLKRYRYSGKERDDETGFYYFGARYYAAWLGRWTSSDPAGFVDGFNLYRYCRNNPVMLKDPTGTDTVDFAVTDSRFTGREHPSVDDFRRLAASSGVTLDPRVNAGNSMIWFEPTFGISLEGEMANPRPGGTWHLHADLPNTPPPPPPPPRRRSSAPRITGAPRGGAPPPPPPPPPPPVAVTPDFSSGTPGTTPPPTARGSVGSVAPMQRQPRATYSGGVRTSENEHVAPAAQLRDITRNPSTGTSDYTPRSYRRDDTTRVTRPFALDKTNDPVQGDNARTNALRARGGAIDLNEDIVIPSARNAARAAAASSGGETPESLNRGLLGQLGNLFETHPLGTVASRLPAQTRGARVLGAIRNTVNSIIYTAQGNNRFGAVGAELGRTFIPFFAEAEVVGIYAHPFVVGTLGITTGPAVGIAEAISAAPTTFAAAVTLPALGGAIVGNAVEEDLGIGGAVVAAAITGAIIGSFIPIPGVSTLAGAAIGACLGVIGYGLSKLF